MPAFRLPLPLCLGASLLVAGAALAVHVAAPAGWRPSAPTTTARSVARLTPPTSTPPTLAQQTSATTTQIAFTSEAQPATPSVPGSPAPFLSTPARSSAATRSTAATTPPALSRSAASAAAIPKIAVATPPAAALPAATSAGPGRLQAAPGTTAYCLILAYHVITAAEPFSSQLAALGAAGFGIVPLEHLVQYVKGVPGATLPERCLVITFDDGWRTQFTFARPALLAAHLPATFFIITNYADQHYAAYMTWDMVKLLAGEGFDVEDHTRSHPRLDLVSRNKGVAALTDEIAGSLQDLEAHIGPTRRLFAYPYGSFDRQVLQVVAQHYDAAVQLQATGIQRPDERYVLHRVMVETTYTPARLVGIANFLETR